MKKAIGLGVLNFVGVVGIWALLELIFREPNMTYIQACTRPLYLIPCLVVAGISGVSAFLKAKKADEQVKA